MVEQARNDMTREIGKKVPLWRIDREKCLRAVREYAGKNELVPPLSLEELEERAERISSRSGFSPDLIGFIMVLLNNEIWRDTFAATPYERRLLLLPQCLRSSKECKATMDEMGLLCMECGCCPIGELQALAERLGYLVLVAEGSSFVMRLLEGGKVDAILGVSCLTALEKSFPQTVANAVPSMAVPLYVDGCVDTKTDLDWLQEIMVEIRDSGGRRRIEAEALRRRVAEWFDRDALIEILGEPTTRTEEIAFAWLAKAGKRWRPLLVAVAYEALAENPDITIETVRPLAVAVECFHKASLIHDDIEDDDQTRYGALALHSEHGIPIAVNAGDLLLGEGYRLLAQCGLSPEMRARLMTLAAEAHHALCIGQGEELDAIRRDFTPSPTRMLDIFRMKTSPAFAVALKFGAVAAGADDALCRSLDVFSDALGIAYQIRDDIADTRGEAECAIPRLSLFSALARETGESSSGEHGRAPDPKHIERKAALLLEHYRNEAVRSLAAFRNADLKSQLRRLLERLLESS
jgi:geranylgeranyl pyrophosphate synthase